MSVEDRLGEYFQTVRRPGAITERGETEDRIEAIFNELGLPWRFDTDGWEIDSDVGPVRAGLDDDKEVLSLWQVISTWDGKPKKKADFLETLLKVNSATTGACFAIFGERKDGDPEALGVIGRIAAQRIDKEEVALALRSLLDMSRLFD